MSPRLAPIALAVLLAACSTVETGSSLRQLNTELQTLGSPPVTVRAEAAPSAEVDALLREPLTMDAAVRLALHNHRGLQARLQALGATEAEAQQAGRLPNPGFGFGKFKDGEEIEWERSLHLNLVRLLTLPLAAQVESRRLDAARRDTAMEVLSLAADTRKAWVQAVAAGEAARYQRQVMDAAEAGAELARRMEAVGNFNKLMRAREQGFHAEAALAMARAQQREQAARERLVRLLGLWGAQLPQLKLPERLPDLPATPREQPDIERLALAQRLDVQAALLATEQTAKNLGLTKATRFVNVLELGLVRNSNNEGHRQKGWEIELELPIFDFGSSRVARAEAVYTQALHQAAATAINARSEVREAYGNYRFAWDIARHHRDELLPLKARIADEQLLRYNGMLIGVFELLADARQQVAAVNAAIEALRDFWVAEASLQMALTGGSPGATALAGAATPAAGATPANH
jgi:outer membrane protein TolC